MTRYMNEAEKRERLNKLSEEEYMRWAYVPFVVAEGAWDYADSVINIAAQMRMDDTKILCRKVRELKRNYDIRRQRHAMTCSGHEFDNFMVMEKTSRNSFKYMYSCINDAIQKQYPDMNDANKMLLIAVYACTTMLDVLYKYMEVQEAHVCEVCGFGSMSSILPIEVHALRKLMPEFAKKTPLNIKGNGLFVHNVVKALCRVRLTKSKGEAG